jgi:5-methylcytosine-specific restriction endonuclease McrA
VSPVAPPHGSVCTGNVLKLLEYQGYRCALTGRRLTPQDTALDHIVPIRQGGEHLIENTQVLHKEVNRAKGSLSNEEFLAMCREVVRWSGAARGKRAEEIQDPLQNTAPVAHGPRSRP